MHDVPARERQGGAVGKRPSREPLDDWLGEISDEDWSEDAAASAQRRRGAPPRRARSAPEGHTERDGSAGWPVQARPVTTPTEPRRAAVERRRAIAALVLLLLIGLAATVLVVLDDGVEAPVTTLPTSGTVTTPADTETDAVPTPAPSTTPDTTTTTTTPTGPSERFTLPEGTKLQRGEATGDSDLTVSTDSELIMELQRALARAGYDPGSPDGAFGPSTEEAVVAFQQANGLSPDGIVGPETADALSRAAAGG